MLKTTAISHSENSIHDPEITTDRRLRHAWRVLAPECCRLTESEHDTYVVALASSRLRRF